LCFDLGFLDVIILSQNANGWELRKMVRNLSQAKKRIPYKFERLISIQFHFIHGDDSISRP